MSTIATAVDKHRPRIVAEVETVLWHDQPGLRRHGRATISQWVNRLVDALVARVQRGDDTSLVETLRATLGDELLEPAQLVGALVRVAGAVRSVVTLEVENRRAVGIASTALDRAVAEVLEELGAALSLEPPTDASDLVVPPRDPTIVRNIREILGSAEEITASLVAVSLRDGGSSSPAASAQERKALRELCRTALEDAGAQMLLDTPALLVGGVTARVDDADAHEAVGTALSVQRSERLGGCGFGVARGGVLVEGADEEGTATGDTLTRAVALATMAKPGVILTDAAVHDLAASDYALRPVEATEPAFRLDPEQPQWLDRWEQASLIAGPEFVGQEEALKELRSHLRSPGHKVTLVGLRGRTGAGKDRLLSATLDEMGIAATRIFRAEPHPLTPAPYWPVITVVRKLLGLEGGPVREERLRQRLLHLDVASAVTTPMRSLLPAVSALLGADEEDASLIDVVEPAALRSEIAKTFRLLLEAAADQEPDRPLVLVLRDVQSVDVPTLHALSHVVRSYQGAAQLIVALCYHGTFRPPAAFNDAGLVEIPVRPLKEREVLRLAASMLEQDELPRGVPKLLRDRASKLPMMATVLMRYLVEIGSLQRHEGVWSPASPVKSSDVPRRLPDLMARRIDRLPPQLASLLKAAATVGEPVAWSTLELVWVSRGAAHDELQRSVGLLEEMGFLARESDGSLRFAHPLIRMVAYRMQTDEERRETHRLAVIAFQERYPDAIRQIPSVLFRHCLESGDAEGARDAAVHAVRRALLLHDHKRGLAVASEALANIGFDEPPSLAARFDLLAARERIHDARGNRDEQRNDIRDMVSLAERLDDAGRSGVALHRAARLNLLTGDMARARKVAGKALLRLRRGDPLDLSNALRTLALIRWQERDPVEAEKALREALAIYERLEHRRGMGFVLHNLGMFALDTGAIEQARSHFERALELKEQTDDHPGRAVALDSLGQVALLEGDDELAAARFSEALAIRDAGGDDTGSAQTRVNLGLANLDADPAGAESLAREALKLSGKKRQARTKVEAGILLARALLAQGSREPASRAAAQALRGAANVGQSILHIRARLARAEVDLAYKSRRRLERAVDEADQAAQAALDAGAVRWRIEALSLVAAARERLDADGAAEAAQEAIALLTERTAVGMDVELIRQRCNAVLADDVAGDT